MGFKNESKNEKTAKRSAAETKKIILAAAEKLPLKTA